MARKKKFDVKKEIRKLARVERVGIVPAGACSRPLKPARKKPKHKKNLADESGG